MSIPLLKKSLELANSSYSYNEYQDKSTDSNAKGTIVKVAKRRQNFKDFRGVGDVKNCNINKLKQVKKKIKKSKRTVERALDNLEYLKRPCINRDIANAILERNNKPKIEEYIAAPEPQGTVFTEEDFQNFEECLRNEG